MINIILATLNNNKYYTCVSLYYDINNNNKERKGKREREGNEKLYRDNYVLKCKWVY